MVRQKYPGLFMPYSIAFVAAFLVWTAACWAYARDRRLSSFALLNLGVPVVVLVMWPALGKGAGLNAETDALAVAITEHGIRPTDVVYWVDSQPSFTLSFYHAIPIRRLISEVEMASHRTGRREVSSEVYLELVRRLQERLRDEPPAYFIVAADTFDLLSRRTDFAVKVVFRLNGFHADAKDELVVFARAE